MSLDLNTISPIGNTLNSLLRNVVVLDVETTTQQKGNVHALATKLVTIQVKVNEEEPIVYTHENFRDCIPILASASCVVGTNLKFDLAWIWTILGWKPTTIWDLQIAEFLFSKQMWKYPDLNTMCLNYGLDTKLDIVKTEYWDKGIDTDQIPIEILKEYGAYDTHLTYEVFKRQVERFCGSEGHMFKLFRVQCNDLLVLLEMENNGIVYNSEKSIAFSKDLEDKMKEIEGTVYQFTRGVPINLGSPEQISKLLYGGEITIKTRIPNGVYKTGAKTGQVKYMIKETVFEFPRLVEPLKGTEKAKEGIWATDMDTLVSLKTSKATKHLIGLLLEWSKLEKMVTTYLLGLPKKIEKNDWPPNMLFSSLNQCLVVTGRLSSSNPNQQNLPKECKKFCESRYDN